MVRRAIHMSQNLLRKSTMSRDLPVIYRAADLGEADIVVSWLRDKGIPAETAFSLNHVYNPGSRELVNSA